MHRCLLSLKAAVNWVRESIEFLVLPELMHDPVDFLFLQQFGVLNIETIYLKESFRKRVLWQTLTRFLLTLT